METQIQHFDEKWSEYLLLLHQCIIDGTIIKEVWLPCTLNKKYMVSSFGNIRHINKTTNLNPGPGKNGYLYVSLIDDERKKNILLNRSIALAFIPNIDNNPIVDHINGSKANNHISNLRWVTDTQSVINTGELLNNKSGKKGVIEEKGKWKRDKSKGRCKNKWQAFIEINKVKIKKRFDTFEEAVEQRIKWEKQYHGEYARKSA